MRRLVGVLLAGWLLLVMSAGQVSAAAATNNITTGIAISPAMQQFVLAPNQNSFGFNVQLYNRTSQAVTMQLSSADFTSLNETGGVAFLGRSVSSVQKAHELGSFLNIGDKTITLAPNATATVPITITNAGSLAVGGHYAAILAQVSASGAGQGNKVLLNQVVSSLVFVETAGQGTKTIKLLPPSIDKLAFSLPSSIDLFFAATGNTQTVPRGRLTIQKDASSTSPQEVGIVNPDSALLLPGSTRLLPTALSGARHPWWPGVYHLQLSYGYDGSLGTSNYEESFLYINPITLLILPVVVVVIVLGAGQLRRLVRFWRRSAKAAATITPVTLHDTVPPVAAPEEVSPLTEAAPTLSEERIEIATPNQSKPIVKTIKILDDFDSVKIVTPKSTKPPTKKPKTKAKSAARTKTRKTTSKSARKPRKT